MEVTATTAALATLGAASIGTGGGFLALSKRPPRYRILDCVRKGGYWGFKGRLKIQTKIFGIWWTIEKTKRIVTDFEYPYEDLVFDAKKRLKEISKGTARSRNVLFDTKFDDINQLGAA